MRIVPTLRRDEVSSGDRVRVAEDVPLGRPGEARIHVDDRPRPVAEIHGYLDRKRTVGADLETVDCRRLPDA